MMSVLETPRLYFTGKITWDPIVTNNTRNYWDIRTSKPVPTLVDPATYRTAVISQVPSHGNWNPDGTHRSVYYETAVRGVDAGSGLTTDDAICNVPVNFAGMLVDVNPYLANTSQLFFDALTVGIDGGPQIVMPNNGPAVATHIVRRNNSLEIAGKFSAIWQASCVTGLRLETHDSGLLSAFSEVIASGAADGLTVRFNSYRTIYFNNEHPPSGQHYYDALKARLEGGGFQPNPARSWIVGVIGLHRTGEPASTPGDRQMSGTLGGAAFAKLNGTRLVVDLGNTIAETDPQGTKQDLGALEITAGSMAIATLTYDQYNKPAYEATAGLVSLDLTAAQADAVADNDLTIKASTGGTTLAEQGLRAVVVDKPTFYLEGNEPASVSIQVLRNGRPVAAPTQVQIAESQRNQGAGPPPPPPITLQRMTARTDATGRLKVTFSTDQATSPQVYPGAAQFVFTPYDGVEPAPPNGTDPDVDCYVSARATPDDEQIAAMPPTWQNVHTYVLGDWEALAPCMDNWLKLGDEAQVRSIAGYVKHLTSRDHFNNFNYMPVTRDMSAGQRTLLHNWCDHPAPPQLSSVEPEFATSVDFGTDVEVSRTLGDA